MILLGPAPRWAPAPRCAQTPEHRCPPGPNNGSIPITGSWGGTAVVGSCGFSETLLLWPSVITWLCPGALLGPGTWMPSHQACAAHLCLVMAPTRTCYVVTAPGCGLCMPCCFIGHTPSRPTPCTPMLSTRRASSQTRHHLRPSTAPAAPAYKPHPAMHHYTHCPSSGPGPPSSVTLILYQTEPEAMERGP